MVECVSYSGIHPKEKGIISQQKIITAIIENGGIVSVPIGDNSSYDFILEYNSKFYRVQCKTGILKNGTIVCNACSCRHNTKSYYKKYYYGLIDIFCIYCFETNKVYIYKYTIDSPSSCLSLRVDFPRNYQKRRISFAKDYELNSNMSALLDNVEPVKFGETSGNGNTEPSPTGEGVET